MNTQATIFLISIMVVERIFSGEWPLADFSRDSHKEFSKGEKIWCDFIFSSRN